MWYSLGKAILKNRVLLLAILFAATAFMGYKASKVQLGYDFTRAIPTDNVKYVDYQKFLKKFGGDGNILVVGVKSDKFFTVDFFNAVGKLHQSLKKVQDVQEVLSVPEAVTLIKDSVTQQLIPQKIFQYPYTSQQRLDSAKNVLLSLPFYQGILYNPSRHAYLLGVTVNKDTINSKARTRLVDAIMKEVIAFESTTIKPSLFNLKIPTTANAVIAIVTAHIHFEWLNTHCSTFHKTFPNISLSKYCTCFVLGAGK